MISNHLHPNIFFHRWIGRLAALGLGASLFASIGLFMVGVVYAAPFMVLMIPFLWGLSVPLFLLTSLYPGVVLHEDGVELLPYAFKTNQLAWDDLIAITEHTLLRPPPPSKLRRKTHTGAMILVKPDKLPAPYKVVGFIAGMGWNPVFAISDRTHTDYDALLAIFEERLPKQELNDV